MENKIDNERFNALQELSQIEMKLSDARVAFENFKKTEEEYLVQREKDVSTKLDNFIENLSDSYKSFSENKETFERIKNILSLFAEKAVNLTAEIKDISAMLISKIEEADGIVGSKMSKIREESRQIKEERIVLDKELENYSERARELNDSEIELNKRKIAFEEKWNDLNK